MSRAASRHRSDRRLVAASRGGQHVKFVIIQCPCRATCMKQLLFDASCDLIFTCSIPGRSAPNRPLPGLSVQIDSVSILNLSIQLHVASELVLLGFGFPLNFPRSGRQQAIAFIPCHAARISSDGKNDPTQSNRSAFRLKQSHEDSDPRHSLIRIRLATETSCF